MVEDGMPANRPADDAGAPDSTEWARVIEVGNLSEMFLDPQGRAIPASYLNDQDALRFSGSRGGVSRRSASVRPGEVFRATTVIMVEGEGDVLPAHFGPMFLGPRDEILIHSVSVKIPEVGVPTPVDVVVVAPAGAIAVRLRVCGGWTEGSNADSLTYTFDVSRLYRRKIQRPSVLLGV